MFRNRYPSVRQRDDRDCGAAALATIALFYGKRVGLSRLRELSATDRAGTNLWGLASAARQLGYAARPAKGTFEALREVDLPAVAHVVTDGGQEHFVVVYRVNSREVVLSDPAQGLQRMAADEFRRRWTGHLLIVTPELYDSSRESIDESPRPARRLGQLIWSNRWVLAETAVCALMMTLLGIASSYFIRHLVDSVLVRGDRALLNAIGVGVLAAGMFRVVFAIVRQYLLAHLSRRIDLSLVSLFARHLLALPMSFYASRRTGEILSRISDVSKVRNAISDLTLTVLVDGILVALTSIVLWMYDVRLAAAATAFAPLMLMLVLAHQGPARRRSQKAMEDAAGLSAHLVEDVSGIETIKSFTAGAQRSVEAEQRLADVVSSTFSMQMLNLSMTALGGTANAVASGVILWYGGFRVIDGALSIGELMFFYTLISYVFEPIKRLAAGNLQLQEALVATDRLFQIVDLPLETDRQGKAKFEGLAPSIDIAQVCFRYGCRDDVLNDITLRIPARGTVAIVGESGCGKTTLLKLLLRYFDPTSGMIRIGDLDLRDLDLDSLRRQVGVVSQESFIFNGSVRDNIALGMPHATMNQIIAAVQAAGLEEFVAGLPQRFDTIIGERGADVSGGQRQRLAIARAVLKNPAILLLDEATSNLDTQTEQAIQRNLRSCFADKTVIMVAHRLSTIREADLICVMHQGRIVEQGTHLQLIAQKGRYAAMWQSQTQGNSTSLSSALPRVNGHTAAARFTTRQGS